MISFAAVPLKFRTTFPDANQDCLQHDRQNKERRPDEEDAGVADASRGDIGKERSNERASGSARCDHRKEPLRLSGVEKLNQEAPKDRDKKEAEHTDEDVEELPDGNTLGMSLQDEPDDRERDRYETVNERKKNTSPDFGDDRAIKWNNCQRRDPRGKVEIGDAIATKNRADRFAHRSHGEIAAKHAKEEEERDDDRGQFTPLDGGQRREDPTCQRWAI